MNLSTPLAWNEDVLLVPVGELPDEMRPRIDCAPEDFALSRPQGRTGSKILDADSADLVQRFREPRTIVEAVILYGRARSLDPEEVLEGAFPLIKSLLHGGFLVPAAGDRPAPDSPVAKAGSGLGARWQAGDPLLGGRVSRVLQVLDDTEVYLLERAAGAVSVLKVERRAARNSLAEVLRREARILSHLSGAPAPRLLGEGEIEGLAYLEMEWIAGLDAVATAAEWRRLGGREGRRRLLGLLQAIADAYATLHARGVLHGDVHPSNVLIERDGAVRLIDFGAANGCGPELPAVQERVGIPFFYEPELARAYLEGRPAPPSSPAGEQHAVAALLYLLATGAFPRDYSLGKEEMLRELAEEKPLTFRERGVAPWPQLEMLLRRALSKTPEARCPSLAAFAAALALVEPPADVPSPSAPAALALDRKVDEVLAAADLDGSWFAAGLTEAPSVSITYGAAGLGLGLLKMGLARGDTRLLSLSRLWMQRAAKDIGRDEGFYNAGIDITPKIVGEGSPYHTPSGVYAAAALVARAAGDPFSQGEALERYLAAVERPLAGLDLTLGRASVLLGTAILLDALPSGQLDAAPLLALGDRQLAEIWRALDAKPAIAEADVEYLGIAHGWAGFLYATLQWCRAAAREIPGGVERRLAELAALGTPVGRGLQWPWTLSGEGRKSTMPGWCNGACGYVFLWTLAHSLSGEPKHLDLAVGAAYESCDAPEGAGSLCCGLAGRGYALLNLYRHTGESLWLDRARDLAHRAASAAKTHEDYPHSLWKGDLGLAVLAVDLERPEQAAMPFFEPLGYHWGAM